MGSRFLCLALLLAMGRAFAADPVTDYSLDSPDKRFRAIWSIDQVHHLLDMKIVSLADPAAKPLLEEIGDAPASDGSRPAYQGIWSADGTRLAVYSLSQSPGALSFVFKEPGEGWPARFLQRTDNPRVQPIYLDDEVTDRVAAKLPSSILINSGAFHAAAEPMASDHTIRLAAQMDFWLEGEKGQPKLHYDTSWTVTNQLTADGFAFAEMGPISCAVRDSTGKDGTSETMPITDQDRLRQAVRLKDARRVSALLAQGVNPNRDPVTNLAALAANRNSAQVLGLLIKAGVDINRNPAGRSWPVEQAILAPDPLILEEILAGKPKLTNEKSSDLYEDLLWKLPRREAQADILGKFRPADEEAAFLRKLQLLVAANIDINGTDEKTGKTALIVAVEGHVSVKLIQALLTAGADPNKKDGEGKAAVDLAADTRQLAVLRLLDTRHRYADFLKGYEIPAGSPFVGEWSIDTDMSLTLSGDGTGLLATMLAATVTWKQVNGEAQIEFHPMRASLPNDSFTGTAKLGADRDTLLLTGDRLFGPREETLHREKAQ